MHDASNFCEPRPTGSDLERQALRLCDKEKERIGRDLHDSIGQQLTGIRLMIKAAEDRLCKASHSEADTLSKIADLVGDTIDQVRAVVAGMAPSEIHNRDAASAIRILCRRTEQTHNISCKFTNELEQTLSNPDMVKDLYLITAEAINNAIRHSQADQIDVRLRPGTSAHSGELVVRNNSCQRDINAFSEVTGIGLTGMHFRAEMMQGHLDILRYPDDYVAIICSFQLSAESKNEA